MMMYIYVCAVRIFDRKYIVITNETSNEQLGPVIHRCVQISFNWEITLTWNPELHHTNIIIVIHVLHHLCLYVTCGWECMSCASIYSREVKLHLYKAVLLF